MLCVHTDIGFHRLQYSPDLPPRFIAKFSSKKGKFSKLFGSHYITLKLEVFIVSHLFNYVYSAVTNDYFSAVYVGT